MTTITPHLDQCSTPGCLAFVAAPDQIHCSIHRVSRLIFPIEINTLCVACGKRLEADVWVKRSGTEHAVCPSARRQSKRRQSKRPLFDLPDTGEVSSEQIPPPDPHAGNVETVAKADVKPRMTDVLWSKGKDTWTTPRDLYAELDREFHFGTDAAATAGTALAADWFGPDHPDVHRRNALSVMSWGEQNCFLNPPYSRNPDFMKKAAAIVARTGITVVCLVPSRTDVIWFHETCWDADQHRPRPGVELRFIKSRLKFSNSKNSAPFPSMVVVLRSDGITR
jgi:phage N-6-adenine-methyltransferase